MSKLKIFEKKLSMQFCVVFHAESDGDTHSPEKFQISRQILKKTDFPPSFYLGTQKSATT